MKWQIPVFFIQFIFFASVGIMAASAFEDAVSQAEKCGAFKILITMSIKQLSQQDI